MTPDRIRQAARTLRLVGMKFDDKDTIALADELEKMGEKLSAGYKLTAKLCALPAPEMEDGHEYIRRDRVMDAVVQWRRVMDGAAPPGASSPREEG